MEAAVPEPDPEPAPGAPGFAATSILLTGGCGFIGAWVAHALRRAYPSAPIVVLDKLEYCSSSVNLEGVGGLEIVQGCVTDLALVLRLLRERAIDTVVHMAAQSHVDRSFTPKSPRCEAAALSFADTNVLGTQVILEAVRQHWGASPRPQAAATGAAPGEPTPAAAPAAPAADGGGGGGDDDGRTYRVVLVSTDEVYGETGVSDGVGVDESAPLNPTNPYAGTKAAAEMIAISYRHSFGLPIVTTRSNNAFGPGQYPEKVVPRFIRLVEAGAKMTLHGQGLTRRSFLYVEDCAAAIVTVLQRGSVGAVYNIGSKTEFTMTEVAQHLAEHYSLEGGLSAHSECVPDPRPYNDKRYLLNDSKIRESLGWEEKYGFSAGLEKTIAWYREHPASADDTTWPVSPSCSLLSSEFQVS